MESQRRVLTGGEMIRRITVENFMAHKSTILDLAKGVTVITGPNNTGKSALVEAVRSISQNPPQSRSAIRHGEKSAVVRVELDSGEIIEWVRTSKTSIYKIHPPAAAVGSGLSGPGEAGGTGGENGATSPEVYAKFGKTPPEDVKALLRLDSVETEAGSVDIHIGNQRYPIFLLDQSGSQAAGFFAASTEAEYLLRMQQALKQRTDRTKAKKKELLKECAEIEAELSRFEPLESLDPLLRRAEELFEAIGAGRRLLPVMEDFLIELSGARERCFVTVKCSDTLNTLALPPGLCETAPLESLVRELECHTGSLILFRSRHDSMAELCRPPRLHEVHGLSELAGSIESAFQLHGKVSSCLDILAKATAPPVPVEVAALDDLVGGIDIASRRSDALRMRSGALECLEPPPMPHALSELERVLSSLVEMTNGCGKASAKELVLREISTPPAPLDVKPMQDLISGLNACRLDASVASRRSEALARLLSPPEIVDMRALEALIDSIRLLNMQTGCTEGCKEILSTLAPLPGLLSNRELVDLIAQISSLQEKIEKTERLRRDKEGALFKKRREVEQFIDEAGTCPFCGLTMDVAHFLEETNHA